jgi:hypothetical protein
MSSRTSKTEFGLNKNRTGLIVGAFSGSWHILWSFLVGIGIAQPFLNWIYGLHFLSNPFHVADFNVVTSALLVFISFNVGYLMGWFFALLWNALPRRQASADLTSRAA